MNQLTLAYFAGDNINDVYDSFTKKRNQPHPQSNFSSSSYSEKLCWEQDWKEATFS